MTTGKIPAELRERPQWVVWKTETRNGQTTKLPYTVHGTLAKSNDSDTWATFNEAERCCEALGFDGIGYVFSTDDEFCGVDLDGCRNAETGDIAEWARTILAGLDSYSEVSPSQTGVKVFLRASSPFDTGKKIHVDAETVSGKQPAIEVYDKLRYFAVTGQRLAGVSPEIESRQTELATLCEHFWPRPEIVSRPSFTDETEVMARARKYLAMMPAAVSGQGGHSTTFRAACVLVLGFGLPSDAALRLLTDWNTRCNPPWSERELVHKVESAGKQTGERNYLRDAKPTDWSKIAIPAYRCEDSKPALRITTMDRAALAYAEKVRTGQAKLVSLGLPEVDYAIGGGVEPGEMVIIAARPSHGKSCAALQSLHYATGVGMASMMVSEEMSAMALGKRAVQFISKVPQESWSASMDEVCRHLTEHFADRAPCYIVESVGTAARCAEQITEAAENRGVQFVVVDYAQLLTSEGRGRYEQVTNTSIALRQAATSAKVVLIVLCQLNRSIEQRKGGFLPTMSDIKDSGQLEQDADVIIFQCWPHRIDPSRDPHEFQFFIAKNRNREINESMVRCRFEPSRQMFMHEKAFGNQPGREHHEPRGMGESDYNAFT